MSMDEVISRLLGHDAVRAAVQHIHRHDDQTIRLQAELSSIPAPTGAEDRRASRMVELFREAGLSEATADKAGNVRAWLNGHASPARNGQAPVILSAHLDTVFGPEINVAVERRGRRLEGPGIGDNARGLVALISVARALMHARVPLTRPVLFAATVGEEGGGDLRGMKYLLNGNGQGSPVAVIALDGAGIERIVHRALGSRRYRVTFRGPGGHSWAAFGVANPANAVGRAASLLADLPPNAPAGSRTTCAIVRLGGGTGLNSIPQEAWLDLDLRSEDREALLQLDETVRLAVGHALEDENRRRAADTAPLELDMELVGERPFGLTPRAHPLVQAAMAANRALGRDLELACASTDANAPIALGIPAIALGAGGRAGDAHLPTEWYENTEGALGLVRAMLVTLAMSGIDG
jgi:acetylornithine deacetylase/succinyl-diaminopimelate desuccinylase-like protein